MAQDYTSLRTFPAFKNFIGAITWTEVKLPSNCSRVQVGSSSGLLYVTHNATDGGAVGIAGTDKAFIPQNNYLTFQIGRGATRDAVIYIAGSTGTPDVSLIIEEE